MFMSLNFANSSIYLSFQSEAEYGGRITGEIPMYREQLKGRFSYRDFWEMMLSGSLASHLVTQHVRVAET